MPWVGRMVHDRKGQVPKSTRQKKTMAEAGRKKCGALTRRLGDTMERGYGGLATEEDEEDEADVDEAGFGGGGAAAEEETADGAGAGGAGMAWRGPPRARLAGGSVSSISLNGVYWFPTPRRPRETQNDAQ